MNTNVSKIKEPENLINEGIMSQSHAPEGKKNFPEESARIFA